MSAAKVHLCAPQEVTPYCIDQKGNHLSVYYHEGTLVLQAQSVVFRVYGEQLALQSSVFDDILSIPQPPAAEQERYDGCPVIRVQDTPLDMYHFLKAIHEYRLAGYFPFFVYCY